MNDNLKLIVKGIITLITLIIGIIFWSITSLNNIQSMVVTGIIGIAIVMMWIEGDEFEF